MFDPQSVTKAIVAAWLAPVRAALADTDDSRGLIVRFPDFRPDLASAMARSLGLAFVDFRKERMARLGTGAAGLSLGELTEAALDAMEGGSGVVLHNAEALLGVHPRERRRQWFARLVSPGWIRPFVVPVTLFGDDIPANSPRVVLLEPALLPNETLLSRLAGLR